jgi:hypothetical protein
VQTQISKKGVTVINIMADGSICPDLRKYELKEPAPEDFARLVWGFIQKGRQLQSCAGN